MLAYAPFAGGSSSFSGGGTGVFSFGTGFLGISGSLKILFCKHVLKLLLEQ